jgi:hypothetical protein
MTAVAGTPNDGEHVKRNGRGQRPHRPPFPEILRFHRPSPSTRRACGSSTRCADGDYLPLQDIVARSLLIRVLPRRVPRRRLLFARDAGDPGMRPRQAIRSAPLAARRCPFQRASRLRWRRRPRRIRFRMFMSRTYVFLLHRWRFTPLSHYSIPADQIPMP